MELQPTQSFLSDVYLSHDYIDLIKERNYVFIQSLHSLPFPVQREFVAQLFLLIGVKQNEDLLNLPVNKVIERVLMSESLLGNELLYFHFISLSRNFPDLFPSFLSSSLLPDSLDYWKELIDERMTPFCRIVLNDLLTQYNIIHYPSFKQTITFFKSSILENRLSIKILFSIIYQLIQENLLSNHQVLIECGVCNHPINGKYPICCECLMKELIDNEQYYRCLNESSQYSQKLIEVLEKNEEEIEQKIKKEEEVVKKLEKEVNELTEEQKTLEEKKRGITQMKEIEKEVIRKHFMVMNEMNKETQDIKEVFEQNKPYCVEEVDCWRNVFNTEYDKNGPIINGINVIESFRRKDNKNIKIGFSYILLEINKIAEMIDYHSNQFAIERTAEAITLINKHEIIRCSDFTTQKEEKRKLEKGLKNILTLVNDMGKHLSIETKNKFKLPFSIEEEEIQKVSIYPDEKLERFGIALKFLMTDIMSIRCYHMLIDN
ncbi:hypothetical protein EHI8A_180750 [Entamoeba histolytica HM-1:IMSS-B]|uniref:Uncharacterized protein n=5 Tax=Entamoeba histolytica TaxID=5759 RepID=C4MBI4_ENTH1|nr:hypothetical protein EHI_154440 [Entamoeba histolytica HM-1:IMSS]EMD47263.1 Hypothetical protein EHI5A_203580 [Entamoeba histolytica KU27]EMH73212.1 hypothetical protein EHI8A_180750 [Entamoeba histolytica HM-1:IMSS-B]EMS12875.1 hypothetical protein KM1_251620 [Entamoeba histolytica HM-3:IMSS]ENY60208.1 hypothetical protein EHI7A_159740 [Entamoeba histolytica HM-1:IMSS-A]EAL42625.1 hypothetical protein EHI_154440 [Entamoeba histolytica HM-1:IMSS]|eukprot:XP_648011.1 hypothetical protein EHI_154440 [Entamoeba histolytica HM-1:IMSS]